MLVLPLMRGVGQGLATTGSLLMAIVGSLMAGVAGAFVSALLMKKISLPK
jgi:hypothetical protein